VCCSHHQWPAVHEHWSACSSTGIGERDAGGLDRVLIAFPLCNQAFTDQLCDGPPQGMPCSTLPLLHALAPCRLV
jgi:hypothetical protein